MLVNMDSSFATVILSSGLSERMGSPKALLKWDLHTTFLEKIIRNYDQAGSNNIICMINRIIEPFCRNFKVPKNVQFVVNEHPDWGRFYSVKTGLSEVRDRNFCFIQNVDNPFVDADIINKIYEKRSSGSWCSPIYKETSGHPVLLPGFIIQKIVQEENLSTTLHDILTQFPKIQVDTDSDSIIKNINTPEEYFKYFNFELTNKL